MRRIELHVDEITVSGAGLDADRVGPVLEEALKLLGERLARSHRETEAARRIVVEQLGMELDGVESLLGPDGPTRVADRLMELIAKEMS